MRVAEAMRPTCRTGLEGLWVAGDWTATNIPCSMESAPRSGFLAVEGIDAGFGGRRRFALDPLETTGLVSLLRRKG